MKNYISNVLIYIASLCGIIAFIGLFASPLQSFNSIQGTWSAYNVSAYFGDLKNGAYKGAILPIFGYIFPLLMSIFLIFESFKPSLDNRLAVINTILAVIFFGSAVLVLLTKELWLNANNLGQTNVIRNGMGPILSAVLSTLAGIILLFVTWIPWNKKIDFIEK